MQILILALAVFGTANLIAHEDGPLDVFSKFRSWATDKAQERGGLYTQLAGVIGCIYCLSVWLGIAAAALHYVAPNLTSWLALPFALSAITMVLDRWVNG